MQRSRLFVPTFLGSALLAGCASLSGAPAQPSMEEMQQRQIEYMTPGAGHQVLNDRVGQWKMEVRYWLPGVPDPMVSLGTSSMQWIMDGRYIEDHTQASTDQGPFEGRGFVGFDNLTKEYVSTWIDSMSTAVMISRGTFDAATNTFNSHRRDARSGHGRRAAFALGRDQARLQPLARRDVRHWPRGRVQADGAELLAHVARGPGESQFMRCALHGGALSVRRAFVGAATRLTKRSAPSST